MRRLFLALLCPVALSAQLVTRDTTIYTATRIRTAANGTVTSISVTKIAEPGKTDTVRLAGPRDSVAFYPRVVANPWHFTFDLVRWTGAGTKPADVAFPSLPTSQPTVVHDTVIKVRVDTVKVPTGPARGDSLPTLTQAIHVDNHVVLYAGGGVPAGNGVYLESSSVYLGSVNASTTGWQAWKYDKPKVDALGYSRTTPPRLLGSYPTQDAAALALYAKCCP